MTAPGYTTALDWELEIGLVLKAPLSDATPDEARGCHRRLRRLTDLSARDVQVAEQDSGFGPQKAKHFASSLSATVVLAEDVLGRWKDLSCSVMLDGVVVARPRADRPRWELGRVLARASASEPLLPGELCGTGTLVQGGGMETGTWLRAVRPCSSRSTASAPSSTPSRRPER